MSHTEVKEYPHSHENEAQIIGCMLKNMQAVATAMKIIPSADCFYALKHQTIFRVMCEMFENGENIEITTVVNELQTKGELDRIGGRLYLVQVMEDVSSTVSVGSYIETLRDHWLLRRVISEAEAVISTCYGPGARAPRIIDDWQQKAFAINSGQTRTGFRPLSGDNATWEKMVEDYQNGDAQERRIMSGFSDLDRVLGGFGKGTSNIIAGDTSHGKTQFALQICENVAIHNGKPVAILSVEMSRDALNARLQCSLANVDFERVKSEGTLSADEMESLKRARELSDMAVILVDDSSFVTPAQLLGNARQAKAEYNIQLLVVDYLQLVEHKNTENRERTVAEISRSMKRIAKKLDIPVLVLSQLRRRQSDSGRPRLRDLRESGAIEQDADTVIFVYHSHDNRGDHCWLIVGKNREGKIHDGIEMSFRHGKWYGLGHGPDEALIAMR